MPKRRSAAATGRTPLILGALAILALLVFAGGELFAFLSSDHGRVLLYRHLHLGDRAHVVRLIGKRVHAGLRDAGVAPSETKEGPGSGTAALRWTVQLPRSGSPMKANAGITREVERGGGVVLSGRERTLDRDGLAVTLVVGLPGFATHEIVIERPGLPEKGDARGKEADEDDAPAAEPPAIALVLFGFGDDDASDRAILKREQPFAVALSAAAEGHEKMLRAARGGAHEIVLLVPMEPERYPTTNPGPGTLLVSMSAGKIESMTRGYLREAGGAIAVANYMGSMATQDEPFVRALYRALQKEGVGFLHLSPAPRAVCRAMAASEGVAYDTPDFTLDAETKPGRGKALAAAWEAVLERAGRHGDALVMMRATPAALEFLDAQLAKKDGPLFRLVAPSTVLHRAPAN
ncbi:MAG: divergent polysaccharide deacetylase family protein [Candidatus Eisenbacteria bacterium]|uniref:Divergent polysaccharide deacetylase family protein n=1 Tax=Eiseniibacteriota bacterium TaxID=2212470 RepID=A0A933W228_UNCEI|nr:divergent polysaccharide deacetylase family protein [Candidatus Eisenbacteria bacterium]